MWSTGCKLTKGFCCGCEKAIFYWFNISVGEWRLVTGCTINSLQDARHWDGYVHIYMSGDADIVTHLGLLCGGRVNRFKISQYSGIEC